MSVEMIIDACDFCTAMIKLNISAVAGEKNINEEKQKLYNGIKAKYAELSELNNAEIKGILSDIYISNIDNDKYGRNKLSN